MGGKVAIVTGSSSGVGEAIAIHLASLGYRLTVAGRNAENLLKVVNKCKEQGLADKEILSMTGDVNDVEFLKKMANDTNEYFNRVDLLVNNAGVGCMKHLSETTVEDYDLVMSTNLRSAFFASQAALPFLKESKGSVVNVSSCGSLQPSKLCVYTMSKAGMDQLTLNTAKVPELWSLIYSMPLILVITRLWIW
ncbi:tropinone reductase homolog At2g29150-like isoform X2 [Anneissia japonica]|uniref:tropinone reductase homolog At2g29150-like isoform X2 n=1 Tax=Anneissia japonica TaxID=1529436 RepID=UPI0014255F1C|nr:tropinone reductase homolog At2g29150-like isoform X2 [Anneissia japonica]